jgi:acid phosphatase (class A)
MLALMLDSRDAALSSLNPWLGVSRALAACACAFALVGAARAADPALPVSIPELRPGYLAGYLAGNALPDSVALLPAPPAWGSAAFALDQSVSRDSFALRDTARWQLAIDDADLTFPNAAGVFSCALQAPVTEQDTPVLYRLLRRTLADAGLTTYAAKEFNKRQRPFVANGQPICTPGYKDKLIKDPSYPSGHATVGWTWALILAEIAPDRATAVIARGRAFGESRSVCNAHWISDVEAGRLVGSVVVTRLHSDPAFVADVATARAELAAVRARGLPPVRDCAAESAALAMRAVTPP